MRTWWNHEPHLDEHDPMKWVISFALLALLVAMALMNAGCAVLDTLLLDDEPRVITLETNEVATVDGNRIIITEKP